MILDNRYLIANLMKELIEAVRKLREIVAEPDAPAYSGAPRAALRREDLRLICFEFLSGG